MLDFSEALRPTLIGFIGIFIFFSALNMLIQALKQALRPAKKSKTRKKTRSQSTQAMLQWPKNQPKPVTQTTSRSPEFRPAAPVSSFGFPAPEPSIAPPVIANAPPKKYEYKAAGALLTQNEQSVLAILQPLVPVGTTLVTKVRLIDLVAPAKDNDYAARNTLWSKHVDFVLIDTASSHPIMVIEVQDRSHYRRDRQRSDETKREALRQAGIFFLELWHTQTYPEIAASFQQALADTPTSA